MHTNTFKFLSYEAHRNGIDKYIGWNPPVFGNGFVDAMLCFVLLCDYTVPLCYVQNVGPLMI